MKREDKIAKRKARAEVRKEKRNSKYRSFLSKNTELIEFRGFWHAKDPYHHRAWKDDSSPTGWTQVCDYYETCQFPCNGDC